MNLFPLYDDPALAAQAHVDQHVVKMTLEAAQAVSTAYRLREPAVAQSLSLYNRTHVNHPVVQWVAETEANRHWTVAYGLALAAEYRYRYDSTHKSETSVLRPLRDHIAPLRYEDHTPFALAMPDEYKQDDRVQAYRDYYLAEKVPNMGKWKRRPPAWLRPDDADEPAVP
jgi:hypothetical protein